MRCSYAGMSVCSSRGYLHLIDYANGSDDPERHGKPDTRHAHRHTGGDNGVIAVSPCGGEALAKTTAPSS